jgi:hypothetical protein
VNKRRGAVATAAVSVIDADGRSLSAICFKSGAVRADYLVTPPCRRSKSNLCSGKPSRITERTG